MSSARPAFAACRLLVAIAVALASLGGSARAEDRAPLTNGRNAKQFEFNLPAQSAADALLEFSKQAKIEVLFSFDALGKVRSTEVIGRFSPEQALQRLLQKTGFTARPHADGKFIVVADVQPTGAIKGKLLLPDGLPAIGVRVLIAQTHYSAVTDEEGGFHLPAVLPGKYLLMARREGLQPLQLPGLTVGADEVLSLPAQFLQRAEDPARLNPYVVKDRTTRRDPFDRSEAERGPRTAGSNLDLARTENDALPFNVYNRDQIARSGVVNLNDFLQRELIDSAVGVPPEQNGNVETFRAGSTNLNLRGFGADQTIILVNGRRLPEALVNAPRDNDNSSQMPDVNFIPLSLVQQVEVLPISAASLYSGNAVGGVINIVLRPGVDAEANEIALTYTNTLSGYDAPHSSASFLHARSLLGGALRVRVNASIARIVPPTEMELRYRQRRPIPDLPLTSSIYRATPNIRSLALQPEGTAIPSTDPPPARPPLFAGNLATVTSVAPGADGNGGLAAFRGREGVRNFALFDSPGGLASSDNSVDYAYGREQVRTAYFGSALYDATSWLQLGVDGTYTHSVLHRGYDVIAADLRLRAESPFNPFGQEATVSLNEMAPKLGQNYNEAHLEFGSVVFSALVKLPREWRLLFDTQYGQNIAQYRGLSGANYARWQEMVDRGRYNLLRDTQVFGPPQEFYDRVLVYRGHPGQFVTLGNYSTIDAAVRATHHAFQLPTGSGALNFGVDYRRNQLARYIDERRFADGTLAVDPIRYSGRTLERYSLFGEVQAPLVPDKWLPRWLDRIDGDLAVRYIASNNASESNVAPTLALKAKFAGGLAFRGSVTTSSRFPTPQMSRIAGPSPSAGVIAAVDVKTAYDPQQKQTYTVQQDEMINPDLRPEETLTQSAGLLFRHGKIHRFRASLDFIDTRKVNELTSLDVQTILNLERLFPERVVRSTVPNADGKVGEVLSVTTGTINSSWRRSHNWNLSLDYAWTECWGGMFEAYGRLLYYTRFDHLLLPNARVVDELSQPEGGSATLLRYRGKFGASWSRPGGSIGMDGSYFHSRVLPIVEREIQGSDKVAAFWQFDAFVQGEIGRWVRWLPDGMRAQVRVNNVLGTEYPRYVNGGAGAGVQVYGDWRGRVYSLSLTTTF